VITALARACLLVVLVLLLATGCAAPRPSRPPPPRLTTAGLTGLTLDLIDPAKIEQMTFDSKGYLPLTVGEKNSWITAPLLRWKIVSGRLLLFKEGQVTEEFTLVSRDTTNMTLRRRDGTIARYKIIRRE